MFEIWHKQWHILGSVLSRRDESINMHSDLIIGQPEPLRGALDRGVRFLHKRLFFDQLDEVYSS